MNKDKLVIVERLRKIEIDPIGEGLARNWHRNPDGPEAAAMIEALYEALLGCEAYFETLEETGDEKHPAMLKLIRGPLALARGEQP